MGLGTPVLVTRVGGLPDLAIDESWIIEPKNKPMLIKALKSKLSSKNIIPKNDNRIKKYSHMKWSEVAKVTNAVYLKLLKK